MAYVPFVPPAAHPPPSPRTRELADLLARVLDEYRRAHPAVTEAEIRAAVGLVARTSNPRRRMAALPLAVGIAVFVLALGMVLRGESSVDSVGAGSLPMVGVAVLILLLAVLVLVRNSVSR